jgi:lysophospholipase L1-like esterase
LPIPERFLALGDSFTIGTGTTPDRSFPAVLARLWTESGRSVVLSNPAVNGYTTDDLIDAELPLVVSFRPTLVTLLIGANDIVQGSSDDRYRRQLRSIHERVRADAPDARDEAPSDEPPPPAAPYAPTPYVPPPVPPQAPPPPAPPAAPPRTVNWPAPQNPPAAPDEPPDLPQPSD